MGEVLTFLSPKQPGFSESDIAGLPHTKRVLNVEERYSNSSSLCHCPKEEVPV